jgi:hypothetical protein
MSDHMDLKLNNFGIEHLRLEKKNHQLYDFLWGLFNKTLGANQPSFSHDVTFEILSQKLKMFLLELSHSIKILDDHTNILPLLILLWVFYTFNSLRLKPVIIF